MAKIFDTNPDGLEDFLTRCKSGKLQLPDFQRSWLGADAESLRLAVPEARLSPDGQRHGIHCPLGDPGDVLLYGHPDLQTGASFRSEPTGTVESWIADGTNSWLFPAISSSFGCLGISL